MKDIKLSKKGVVLCDLDGVIWLSNQPIPAGSKGVEKLRQGGLDVVFLTNNSSLTVSSYIEKLKRANIEATPEQIITSSVIAANYLTKLLPPGAKVAALGAEGLTEAIVNEGFELTDETDCQAVVVGWHKDFGFKSITFAMRAIAQGARFIATNSDPTLPSPEGPMPGNGSLIASISTACDCVPEVTGKPHMPTVEFIKQRFGEKGIVVGDRPTTDGALAKALGWPFALVMSEISHSTEQERQIASSAAVTGADLLEISNDIIKMMP